MFWNGAYILHIWQQWCDLGRQLIVVYTTKSIIAMCK